MLEWIRSVSGDPVQGGVQEALKDGRTLCKLMNCLQPGEPAASGLAAEW